MTSSVLWGIPLVIIRHFLSFFVILSFCLFVFLSPIKLFAEQLKTKLVPTSKRCSALNTGFYRIAVPRCRAGFLPIELGIQ